MPSHSALDRMCAWKSNDLGLDLLNDVTCTYGPRQEVRQEIK